jgi:hypothetical protein
VLVRYYYTQEVGRTVSSLCFRVIWIANVVVIAVALLPVVVPGVVDSIVAAVSVLFVHGDQQKQLACVCVLV